MRMSSAVIRQWHSYIGLFIAPSVLFFALTGASQLFSLHEAHGHYHPFAIVEKLSSVHKDQVFELGHHDDAAPEPDAATGKPADTAKPAGAKEDDDKTELSTLLLKGFFLLVALCLTLSTALGLWMGLTQNRRKGIAWLLVIAGTLVPLGLLVF
jgi:hypothetical protein